MSGERCCEFSGDGEVDRVESRLREREVVEDGLRETGERWNEREG